MNSKIKELIVETAKKSSEGKLHFGEVVQQLIKAGVEFYFADYNKGETTYYLPNNETLVVRLDMPDVKNSSEFNVEAIQAAIRGSQEGVIQYPEFKKLSKEAGCIGYIVWILGRYVTYFGRKGETHIEKFPN